MRIQLIPNVWLVLLPVLLVPVQVHTVYLV